MRSNRLVWVMCFLVVLAGCGKSGSTKSGDSSIKNQPGDSSNKDNSPGPMKVAEKTIKEKLIGTWEAIKINGKVLPNGVSMTMEFADDGKSTRIDQRAGKIETEEATYTLDNTKITVTVNTPGKKGFSIMTIKSITDKQLILEGAQNFEFKKK